MVPTDAKPTCAETDAGWGWLADPSTCQTAAKGEGYAQSEPVAEGPWDASEKHESLQIAELCPLPPPPTTHPNPHLTPPETHVSRNAA